MLADLLQNLTNRFWAAVPWTQGQFTLAVVLILFLLLTFSTLAPDVILILGVVVLLVAGVITPGDALSGLSNEAMVTVGVLFIVGAGVRETGGVDWIAARLFGRPRSVTAADSSRGGVSYRRAPVRRTGEGTNEQEARPCGTPSRPTGSTSRTTCRASAAATPPTPSLPARTPARACRRCRRGRRSRSTPASPPDPFGASESTARSTCNAVFLSLSARSNTCFPT